MTSLTSLLVWGSTTNDSSVDDLWSAFISDALFQALQHEQADPVRIIDP